jgi:succinate dehydrogenase / fumarate reductase flavoprotein subunit/L-aspartate oxidase
MSGYTPELKGLIKKVEATRPKRVERARKGEHFPALTMEQRNEWLNKFHPDYKSEGRSKVRVGPNKGGTFPEEVTRLLESRSRLNSSAIDLSKTDYSADVLVIGGGGAGTAAALTAGEAGPTPLWQKAASRGPTRKVTPRTSTTSMLWAADTSPTSPIWSRP